VNLRSFAYAPLLLVLVSCAAQPPSSEAIKAAGEVITPDSIEAHMRFLADDALKGRETGSPGYAVAADYVAAQFQSLGLEPAGTGGTWFQEVPFAKTKLVESKSSITLTVGGKTKKLPYGSVYTIAPDYLRDEVRAEAQVVFVGFGVTAPDFEYDDYADVDVRGKIIAYFRGAPPTMPHNERAYYSWARFKKDNAVKHGAIGMVQIRTPENEKQFPWEKALRNSHGTDMRWMDAEGRPSFEPEEIKASGSINTVGAKMLFAGSSTPLDSVYARSLRGKPGSFPLDARLDIVTVSERGRTTSKNVVARLPGADPKLREENVLISAHLDHIGVTEPVNGDSINNGAYDNASGIAATLEVARAFGRLQQKPRRSILFLATTGEEKGLQGADYFSEQPTVPIESIVANTNLDMFLMLCSFEDVVAFGAEHSSLGAVTEKAAANNGFKVSPDPVPEEVIFIRSDQFPFVRKGIPAVFITSGRQCEGGAPADTMMAAWRSGQYHNVSDDMSQKMDFNSGVRFARTNFEIALDVANGAQRPTWNPGDYFGEKFAGAKHANP
jgi:hypothetical protein